MTIHATLNAEKRDATGKGAARKLRARGLVPGVIYGQGGEALAVTVQAHEAEHLFHQISVENTLVDVTVDGESFQTLVREVQVHPIRPELLHIDFYKVQKGVRLHVEIPVHLNGVPEGVKSHGGVLQQVIHELPVLTLPSLIPETVEIDVTHLDVGDSIHVSDLELPEEVEIQLDDERTVCSVVIPKGIVEEDEEEEEEELEPELVGEGEEGEEAAAEGEGEAEAGEDESGD